MRDMHEDRFEDELSALFQRPTGEADPLRLRLAVLERVAREDRRRRIVITSAAAVGAAIAASTLAASGLKASALVLATLPAIDLPEAATSMPWLIGATVLAGLTLLSGRALRDV